MSRQSQIFATRTKTQEIDDLLAERADHAISLKAPYTIYIKPVNATNYVWLAFSLGRPRNVVWGTVSTPARGSVNVQHGCSWNGFGVLNEITSNREATGFVVAGTLAKDQIRPGVFGYVLAEAYNSGNGANVGFYVLNANQVRDLVDDELMRRGLIDVLGNPVSANQVLEVSKDLAAKMFDTPNYSEIKKETGIPDEVVAAIDSYIERNPTLVESSIPLECPTLESCMLDPSRKECEVYYGREVL